MLKRRRNTKISGVLFGGIVALTTWVAASAPSVETLAASVAPEEWWPAGTGSVQDASKRAFELPLNGVTVTENREFHVGNSFFKDTWVVAPASTAGRDGLGPLFNANACAACHLHDGRGRGVFEDEFGQARMDLSLLFRLSRRDPTQGWMPIPGLGEQLQPFGIPGVQGEGRPQVQFRRVNGQYPDGTTYELLEPIYDLSQVPGFAAQDRFSPRVGNQLIGLGLLEMIEEKDLLSFEDPKDLNGDGISGRAQKVIDPSTGQLVIGRFGWKAGQASLLAQNAAAFHGDLGLTTRLHPKAHCESSQTDCLSAPSGGDPEVEDHILDRLTTYTRLIAVPQARGLNRVEVIEGREHFQKIGCASCHSPSWTTSSASPHAVLRSQKIFPYTNLLLHDLGPELADHRHEAIANGREWRTSPLWGIGLLPTVNGHQNLLHDGRARNVEEAILWHGGEANASREAFKALSSLERRNLIEFVNAL